MTGEGRTMRKRRDGSQGRNKRSDQPGSDGEIHGFTTEEDTGLDSGYERERAFVPTQASINEGGDKLFSKVKLKKMIIRAAVGTAMMVSFAGIIWCGHAYVCALVFLLQCFIFSELVGVRKKMAAETKIPLFRSLQWAWFFVAVFFTWSAQIAEFVSLRGHTFTRLKQARTYASFVLDNNMIISFGLYAALLVVSVLSLRKGLYRYQLTQYTWTIVTICIVVFQTQAVFQIVYAGLFWFVLPSSLVICNDIMAYFCGQFFGKKFIKRRFLELSPNKTWEGFLGSAVCTLVFAYYIARWMSDYNHMICVPDRITFEIDALTCTPDKMYQARPLHELSKEVLPDALQGVFATLAAIAPGFAEGIAEIQVESCQLHAMVLGLFASFVAPFGGFLSSAIKRAYGIKDFNNIFPGHGGMMDRFDCQFVMFLCTYVHHRSFCKVFFTLEAVVALATKLTEEDQRQLLRQLEEQLRSSTA
eukprot:TRINITY_DN123202_c0_g1_i1.p1 TRINITY_DN123202_c0_g1~~TRINITY_DN123202_c0_g1_i1.p1  ORF type:complete len:499 (-),score=111.98 TRINITY_DN123202_c0_g1_i1:374-1792(-)